MKRISTLLRILFILLLFYASSSALIAQTGDWEKIGADIDGNIASEHSGKNVSLSSDGNIVAIGAPDTGNGRVRVYQNQSGSWVQVGSDIIGETSGDQFGRFVSLSSDGSILAVGSPSNDGNGDKAGSTRIYENQSNSWILIGEIDGEAAGDESGISLSISSDGTIVAIGAYLNDGAGADAGHTRVYQNNAGIWTQIGVDIDGEAPGDRSGFSVSLSSDGSIVAIGAYFNDGAGPSAGHTRVYQNISGNWTQIGSDIDGQLNYQSGVSVSLNSSGSRIAVGAYRSVNGSTRIYENQSGTWTIIADINGEASGDDAGKHVHLSSDGTFVAIGAVNNDGAALQAGHVRIYQEQSGVWVQIGSDINGNNANDFCGSSVNIRNGIVAVGIQEGDPIGKANAGIVRLYSFKTDDTWTGTVDNNWHTAGNWDIGLVPDVNFNVVIPGGLTNYPTIASAAVCYNLTMESTAGSTGSVLGQSNLTVSGTTTVERHMTGNSWHFVASPVPGQTISSFLTSNTNIPTKDVAGIDRRGMMDYNEPLNNWNSFFTDADAGNLGGGQGYSLRTDADGTVVFAGSLQTGDVNPVVSRTAEFGWNCVGNPYPSAIFINSNANATNNFIDLNDANFDPSYKAVYVWEQGNNAYTIVAVGSPGFTAALGQAFMVKAKTGVTEMNFTPALQTHDAAAELKSNMLSSPSVKLVASIAGAKASTLIKFDQNMSEGLDTGYDAGMFKTGFDLFTRLVKDNGVDFGIQCLPTSLLNNGEILLGLQSTKSGEVSFSVETQNMPLETRLMLEDRLNNSLTELKVGEVYTTQFDKSEAAKGRFFLHTLSSVTGVEEIDAKSAFRIYQDDSKIYISGIVEGKAYATLFDIMGRTVRNVTLENSSLNSMEASTLKNGIYLLKIKNDKGTFSQKVLVKNQ